MSDEPKAPGKPEEKTAVSRRDFFNEIAGGALTIAGLGAAVVTVKYASPNVLFEPPTTFRAGSPDDYPVNSVTYLQDQQVYIVRTDKGMWALSAVCTHLGCITQWKPESDQIALTEQVPENRRRRSRARSPAAAAFLPGAE